MKILSSREILLPYYPLECLTRRLDAVEQISAIGREQPHDLVLPRRRRHSRTPRVEVDNLSDFEFVLPYSICWQVPVLPTPLELSQSLGI
jgi:hypothetical protein